jgi:hypothetical protein
MNFLVSSNEPEATTLYLVDTVDWNFYTLVYKKQIKGHGNRPEKIIMPKVDGEWICGDNSFPELNSNLQREIEWYYKAYSC